MNVERRNVETINGEPCESSGMATECPANSSCSAAGTFSSETGFIQRTTRHYVTSTRNEDESRYPQGAIGLKRPVQRRKFVSWHVTRLNDFLRNGAHRTFVFFSVCTDYRWSGRKANLIALSCLFFAVPALTLLPVCAWEAWLWAAVCVLSYLADYTFSGRRDTVAVRTVHMTDRYLASVMFGIQVIYNIPLWFHKGVTTGVIGTAFTIASCFCQVRRWRNRRLPGARHFSLALACPGLHRESHSGFSGVSCSSRNLGSCVVLPCARYSLQISLAKPTSQSDLKEATPATSMADITLQLLWRA